MKEIKTGYFARQKQYEEAGYKVIGIAIMPPKWYQGKTLYELAPTKQMVNGIHNTRKGISTGYQLSWGEYQKQYWEILQEKDIKTILLGEVTKLKQDEKGIVLCCYEKDPAECHRSILAEYCRQKYKINIEEFCINKISEKIMNRLH